MEHINRFGPASVILIAAIIFAGSLAWYASHAESAGPQSGSGLISSTASTTPKGPAPDLGIYHTPVVGFVTSIGTNTVTLSSTPQSTTTVATVDVISNTDIYKQGPLKDPAQYQQESAMFQQQLQNGEPGTTYISPDQYTHISLSFSDIQVGDFLYVIPTAEPVAGQPVTAESIQVSPPPTQ